MPIFRSATGHDAAATLLRTTHTVAMTSPSVPGMASADSTEYVSTVTDRLGDLIIEDGAVSRIVTDDHRYHTFQSITAQGIDLKLTTDYEIHLPEGIVRTTTPDGKNTFYDYDQHQRLTRVAVGNNELLHQIRYSNASSR